MSSSDPEIRPVHVAQDERFKEHLKRSNPLEVLLRGHLWAESELIGILEDSLPHPELINFSRLSFPLKVTLVAASGYMQKDDIPAFLKLNSLRNRLAHNLHAELNEESVNELLGTFGEILRYTYPDESEQLFAAFGGDDPPWVTRLRAAIACLCIHLSSQRERIEELKRQDRENHTQFLELVAQVKAAYKTDSEDDRQG
jgi:hypothetical protein